MAGALSTQKTYFRGFGALRFYAALSVVIQHMSYSPHDWFGVPLLPVTVERFFLNGDDAVNMFFVLSGFLITYLLLFEGERTGTVSIRNFYLRRVFRIFPVYFAFLLVTVLLLRPPYDLELFLLLIFFMGNVAFVTFFPFPPFEHLWSIGVEEQFYLLAPVLARQRKHLAVILLAIIFCWWLINGVVTLLPYDRIALLVRMSRFDLIALGALTAYGYYHGWPLLRWLRHRAVRWLAYIIIAFGIVFVPPTAATFIYTTVMGFAFTVIILNLSSRAVVPRLLDNAPAELLGKLSYSLYVYHPLLVLLYHSLFYERLSLVQYQLIGYPLVVALSVGLSYISYRFLEAPTLRYKARFRSVSVGAKA